MDEGSAELSLSTNMDLCQFQSTLNHWRQGPGVAQRTLKIRIIKDRAELIVIDGQHTLTSSVL